MFHLRTFFQPPATRYHSRVTLPPLARQSLRLIAFSCGKPPTDDRPLTSCFRTFLRFARHRGFTARLSAAEEFLQAGKPSESLRLLEVFPADFRPEKVQALREEARRRADENLKGL